MKKEKLKQQFEKEFKTGLSRDLTVLFNYWWNKLDQQKEEIIKQIETRKQLTRKEYGTFKYDSTYDEAIDIIKKI